MNSESETKELMNNTAQPVKDIVEISAEDAMGDFESAQEYVATVENKKTMEDESGADKVESVMSEEYIESFEAPVKKVVQEDNGSLSGKADAGDTVVHNIPAVQPRKQQEENDFVSEFAPAPISIPKYDKEKERKRAAKVNEKNKKKKTAKSKKRRKTLQKIIFVARTVCLFLLLIAVLSTMLFSLLVKMNTTEYSIETAIRENYPERFVIGKIPPAAVQDLNLKESSSVATLIDVIRDNKTEDHVITYQDIEREIMRSSYPKFLAKVSHDVVEYYLLGKTYEGITEEDVVQLLKENSNLINQVTGRSLGETACRDYAKYIVKSTAFKEMSAENVKLQAMTKKTEITSILFSTTALISLVIVSILLIVLALISCRGFAHKIIGWAIMLAGVIVGVAGYFTGPMFNASSMFVKNIVDVLTTNFNESALVWSGAVIVVGIIIMILGKAISDSEDEEDDEYYEDDYIDEIEQVATAQ